MTLSKELYKKIEKVKKVNPKMEDSESQLANSNIAMEEPSCMFTKMWTCNWDLLYFLNFQVSFIYVIP